MMVLVDRFQLFLFYLFFIYLILFLIFRCLFGIKVSGKLMNVLPWTASYNAVLQPPSTSNPKI